MARNGFVAPEMIESHAYDKIVKDADEQDYGWHDPMSEMIDKFAE